MKSPPSSPFALVATAWTYFRKHPVFVPLWIWTFTLPFAIATVVPEFFGATPETNLQWALISLGLWSVALLFVLWGFVGVLLVAKRMIDQNKAGRARTSMKAVLGDAAPLFFPLLFTSILRFCYTMYRALLFIVPVAILAVLYGGGLPAQIQTMEGAVRGALVLPILLLLLPLLLPAVIYNIRTSLYEMALVTEGMAYRKGLKRSRELTLGRFWHVVWTQLALGLLLILPPQLLTFGLEAMIGDAPMYLRVLVSVASLALAQFGALIFTLALVAYYGWLRKAHFTRAAKEATK